MTSSLLRLVPGPDAAHPTESPEDRLLRAGATALHDAEILAVLLRSTAERAHDLLGEYGGHLPRLFEAGPTVFASFPEAGQASLQAALELARRLVRAEVPEREPLRQPADIIRYLALRYRILDQEVVGALYLDSWGRLITIEELCRGTLDRACVEPRVFLRQALLLGAHAFVMFHTHPSGQPTPSQDDIAFTRHLAAAASAVGLKFADHIIVGEPGKWTSLRETISW